MLLCQSLSCYNILIPWKRRLEAIPIFDFRLHSLILVMFKSLGSNRTKGMSLAQDSPGPSNLLFLGICSHFLATSWQVLLEQPKYHSSSATWWHVFMKEKYSNHLEPGNLLALSSTTSFFSSYVKVCQSVHQFSNVDWSAILRPVWSIAINLLNIHGWVKSFAT